MKIAFKIIYTLFVNAGGVAVFVVMHEYNIYDTVTITLLVLVAMIILFLNIFFYSSIKNDIVFWADVKRRAPKCIALSSGALVEHTSSGIVTYSPREIVRDSKLVELFSLARIK